MRRGYHHLLFGEALHNVRSMLWVFLLCLLLFILVVHSHDLRCMLVVYFDYGLLFDNFQVDGVFCDKDKCLRMVLCAIFIPFLVE